MELTTLLGRFDNSGHRVGFPGWHSNPTNVQRTDTIIKTIASMFATQTNVVPIIAPLNEYVTELYLKWTNRLNYVLSRRQTCRF
jgi:hypothetical protein